MRINQYLAAGTGLSRRAADAAISAGRVQLNSQTATLGMTVEDGGQVTLDGVPVALPAGYTYLMLNKPAGYVSSRVRQTGDPTLYELLPAQYHRLRTAGRLDRESSGLIVLSDDGNFLHALTHPGAGKVKRYELTLARALTPADTRRLESGVQLTDGLSRLQILEQDGRRVTVALGEGRNRQLRRTFGKLGYTVERLHRLSVGEIELGKLEEGKWAQFIPEDTAL